MKTKQLNIRLSIKDFKLFKSLCLKLDLTYPQLMKKMLKTFLKTENHDTK